MSFEAVINPLLEAEGGMRIHEQEPGGASNMGVSLVTLRKFRADPSLTHADLALLTRDEAKLIYKTLYWDLISGDLIKGPLTAHLMFDQVVNRGVEGLRALLVDCLNKRYQKTFTPDSFFSDLIAAANEIEDRAFFRRLLADAQHSYREIAFNKMQSGKWSPELANETLRIWMIRTHNLMKLLV